MYGNDNGGSRRDDHLILHMSTMEGRLTEGFFFVLFDRRWHTRECVCACFFDRSTKKWFFNCRFQFLEPIKPKKVEPEQNIR